MELDFRKLREGYKFIFQTKDKDDLRELEIKFNKQYFLFWFNGTNINSCKTQKTCELILEALTEKWDLEFNRIE